MDLARAADQLLTHALSLPEAWEDHPWGERVAKVGMKVFLFFGRDSGRGNLLFLAVKLPTSGLRALDRPECEPTNYGMGKHGWVSAKYERGDVPPLELLESWIVESYRAVAPKKLVKLLDQGVAPATERRAKPVTKPAVTKPVVTKPVVKKQASSPAKRAAAKPRRKVRAK